MTIKEAIVIAFLNTLQPSLELDKHEVMCLSEAVYREARGESFVGKVSVAHSLKNRIARNPDYYGKTFCDLLKNKAKQHINMPWAKNPPKHRWNELEQQAYQDSIEVSVHTILGYSSDPTNGATHFDNPKKHNSKWFKQAVKDGKIEVIGRIDNQMFYKEVN